MNNKPDPLQYNRPQYEAYKDVTKPEPKVNPQFKKGQIIGAPSSGDAGTQESGLAGVGYIANQRLGRHK